MPIPRRVVGPRCPSSGPEFRELRVIPYYFDPTVRIPIRKCRFMVVVFVDDVHLEPPLDRARSQKHVNALDEPLPLRRTSCIGFTQHAASGPRGRSTPKSRVSIARKRAVGRTVCGQSAQRAHSKLQKPPHTRAAVTGATAAATNTEWQGRNAAGGGRAGRLRPPRRVPPA